MTELVQFVSVTEVENSAIATLSTKTEFALNGRGSSPIHLGADFLLLTVRAREHSWSTEFKGNAFVAISKEGELTWIGCSALRGGMAYCSDPGAGHWEENKDKTYWIWTPDQEGLPTVRFGIGELLRNWEKESTPIACVRVQVSSVESRWGCNPFEKTKGKPTAAQFTKTVKVWGGEAHFASEEEITLFKERAEAKHPENVIPESWLIH